MSCRRPSRSCTGVTGVFSVLILLTSYYKQNNSNENQVTVDTFLSKLRCFVFKVPLQVVILWDCGALVAQTNCLILSSLAKHWFRSSFAAEFMIFLCQLFSADSHILPYYISAELWLSMNKQQACINSVLCSQSFVLNRAHFWLAATDGTGPTMFHMTGALRTIFHPSTKFCTNLSSNICVILLIERKPNTWKHFIGRGNNGIKNLEDIPENLKQL